MSHKESWTDEEDSRLRTLWKTRPIEEIARELGRHYDAIRARACMIGLRRPGGCIVDKKRDDEYMQKVRAELGTVGESDE